MRAVFLWTIILTLENGPTGCPEMLARNYHYSPHNSP